MNSTSRLVVALVATTSLVACGQAESTYFPTSGKTEVQVPIVSQEPVYFGVELLSANGADVVHLESIDLIDARGEAVIEGLVSKLGDQKDWIGSGTATDLRAAGIDLNAYAPLPGAAISASDGPVALAVRLTGRPPVFGFGSLRLRFRVNDGPSETEIFTLAGTVCSGPELEEAKRLCGVGDG